VPAEGRGPNELAAMLGLADLSPDFLQRLKIYERLLGKWQRVINLVGPSTLENIWVRHFADSLQVSDAVPTARKWVDMGSGAGFPGLVTALRYTDDPNAAVHLIESDQRKCAFLREVSRETGAPAIIHCGRLEDIIPILDESIDAVSARALAPLPILIAYADKFLKKGAIGVFPKGEQAAAELTDSASISKYSIVTVDSRTRSLAKLFIVKACDPQIG